MLEAVRRLFLGTTCDPFPKFENDLGIFISAEEILREQEENWIVKASELHSTHLELLAKSAKPEPSGSFLYAQDFDGFPDQYFSGYAVIEVYPSFYRPISLTTPEEFKLESPQRDLYFKLPADFFAERDDRERVRRDWRKQLVRGHRR